MERVQLLIPDALQTPDFCLRWISTIRYPTLLEVGSWGFEWLCRRLLVWVRTEFSGAQPVAC